MGTNHKVWLGTSASYVDQVGKLKLSMIFIHYIADTPGGYVSL